MLSTMRRTGRDPRRGHTLVAVAVMIAALFPLTGALLFQSTSYKARVATELDLERAAMLAKAGLNEATTALRFGSSGNVGTLAAPARLGDGLLWVTAEDLGNGRHRLVSTAATGSGRAAWEMVVESSGGVGELFRATLNAKGLLTMNSDVMVDSFDSSLGSYASQAVNSTNGHTHANTNGDVRSDDDIILNSYASVFGDATPGPGYGVTFNTGSYVHGSTTSSAAAFEFPPIEVPPLPPGGAAAISGTQTFASGDYRFTDLLIRKNAQLTIEGPANVVVDGTFTGDKDASLVVDATQGPVTIYCETYAHMNGFEASPAVGSPMAVAFLVSGTADISFPSNSMIRGAYYAENSNIVFANNSEAWGSFVGNQVSMSSAMNFHFDEDLARHWAGGGGGSGGGDVEVDALAWYETSVEPAFLRRSRRDPFELLGVTAGSLNSPAQSWID